MEIFQKCIIFFILWTLLQELVPKGTFQKHMRLMGGLIFLLLFFQMLFGTERLLPSLYKNYYRRIVEDVADEKGKEVLYEEYEQQTRKQVEEYLKENGYQVAEVDVDLKADQIWEIRVKLENVDEYDEIQVKKKLSDVYSLEESHINVES